MSKITADKNPGLKKLMMAIYGVPENEVSKPEFKKQWGHPKTIFYHYIRRFVSECALKKVEISVGVQKLDPEFMALHVPHTSEMIVAAYALLKLIGAKDIFNGIVKAERPTAKLYSPSELAKILVKVDKINIERYREIYKNLFDVQWSTKPIEQWILPERLSFLNSILDRIFSVRIEYVKQEPAPYYMLKPRPQFIKKY